MYAGTTPNNGASCLSNLSPRNFLILRSLSEMVNEVIFSLDNS